MDMLRTIERPTNTTLRPYLWAASTTCCTRCTWEEKLATMILRVAWANAWSRAGPMEVSGLTKPGSLGVGGVHHQQVHALFADLAEFDEVGDAVVERQLVPSLISPVSIREPAGVLA